MSIHDFTQQWYTYNVPPITSPDYVRFLSGSAAFIKHLNPTAQPVPTVALNREMITAKVDVQRNRVVLPVWPTSWDACKHVLPHAFVDVSPRVAASRAIALFNALIVHEAAHILYTSARQPPARQPQFLRTAQNRLYQGCTDVVEDMYIDAQNRKRPFQPFVTYWLDTFLSEHDLNSRAHVFSSSSYNPVHALNLLICYKNPAHWSSAVWDTHEVLDTARDFLAEAVDTHNADDRAVLADHLYELLYDHEDSEAEETGDTTETSPSDPYSDTPSKNRPSFELFGDRFTERAASKKDQKIHEALDAAEMQLPEGIADDVLDAEREAELAYELIHKPQAAERGEARVEERDVLPGRGGYTITCDPTFNQLGEHLRRILHVEHVPEDAHYRGARLDGDELWRVALDQRIFEGDVEERKLLLDTIILVDASGSMLGHMQTVVSAVWGAVKSMHQAHLPVRVYAHNTGYECIDVMTVCAVPQQYRQLEERLQALCSRTGGGNYDGFAIEHVARKFSTPDATKLLIMVCDGWPVTPSNLIPGFTAEEHTAEVVNRLRLQEIIVAALSLTDTMARCNDDIYGADWNIDASQHRIGPQLHRLVRNVALSMR